MDFKSENTLTTTDDIDELFSWSEGWSFEYTQLTAGKLGFREQAVQLPGVAIKWHTTAQGVLVRETFLSGLGLGFVRESVGRTRWRGRGIDVNDGLLYQNGGRQTYTLSKSTRSMSIELDDRLVGAFGWNLNSVVPIQRFDPVAIAECFERICSQVEGGPNGMDRGFPRASCSIGFFRLLVTSRCGVATTSPGPTTLFACSTEMNDSAE